MTLPPSGGASDSSSDPDGDSPPRDDQTLPMRSDTRISAPRSGETFTPEPAATEKSGDRVGAYTLLERIGVGGFGVVWRAERREPYVQQVAIKLLRPGMDSESVLARFEQERQSLALMDHPNIAKVIDGGITQGGRNYFVMELVRGEPITRFCDRHKLTIERRLQLFAQACDAIQHAHMKGIIHRDLKPGNILAAMGDTDGLDEFNARVKIIDFGVAKATARPLTERQLFTEVGQMIGTPEYMSPEQADGGLDIDTRTDVYALGVVLYELLVGATPFDPKSLRSAGLAAIHRIIRETDPPRPSDRLRAMGTAAADPETPSALTVAQERATKSQTLLTRLREELEWLPMKAMRKDRSERYRSAAELADDIRNYLDGKPLVAGPESAAYRARKFVRRHRAAALSTALIAGVIVAAAIVSTIFWIGEVRQRLLAEKRSRQVRMVSEFQQDMLESAVPETVGPKLSAIILRRAQEAVRAGGDDEGVVQARLQATEAALGQVNAADLARELLDVAILEPATQAAREQFAEDPQTRADLEQVLAIVRLAISNPKLALALQQSVRAIREQTPVDSTASAEQQLKRAQASVWFGRILDAQPGSPLRDDALAAIQAGCDLYAQVANPLDPDALLAREILASALIDRGRNSEAAKILIDVRKRLDEALRASAGRLDPKARAALEQRMQTASLSLGEKLRNDGDSDAALALLQPTWNAAGSDASVPIRIRFKLLNNLALAKLDSASDCVDSAQALALRTAGLDELRRAVGLATEAFGDQSSETALAKATLAQTIWQVTGRSGADEILRITPEPADAKLEAGSRALPWRAQALRALGRGREADTCIQSARTLALQLKPLPPWTLAVLASIAEYHEQGASFDQAVELRKLLVEQRASAPVGTHGKDFVNASADLANTLLWAKRPDAARGVLEAALERARKPLEDGGLSDTSDARWNATNLLAHAFAEAAMTPPENLTAELAKLKDARSASADGLSVEWVPDRPPSLPGG